MNLRSVSAEDGPELRELVTRSMKASYSLGPATIEAAVEEWFGDEALTDKLDDDEYRLVAAEDDSSLVCFAECVVHEKGEAGDIHWIHVSPEYRGEGIGEELFEHVESTLGELGAEYVRGLVLANNADGTAFYHGHGFEQVGEREIEIDGSTYTEHIYHDQELDRFAVVEDDGRELYVDHSDVDRGSLSVFYRVYTDRDTEELYGYQCGNCESLANAMDAMGRIECSECGNTRKPTRWDAAYL
jgi:ribosomal protein S18 acetylase RimI-like enzyme